MSSPAFMAPRSNPDTNTHSLSHLHAKAAKKLEASTRKRAGAKRDATLLTKFKGQFPPSLTKVMAGEAIADGIGFNKIAMQIAITAHALGKTEEQVLAACEGLAANHVSDGHRYETPEKRRGELARMYDYTADNPCYDFSAGGVRSLLPKRVQTPDLDGLTPEIAGESLMEPGDDIRLAEREEFEAPPTLGSNSMMGMGHAPHTRNRMYQEPVRPPNMAGPATCGTRLNALHQRNPPCSRRTSKTCPQG